MKNEYLALTFMFGFTLLCAFIAGYMNEYQKQKLFRMRGFCFSDYLNFAKEGFFAVCIVIFFTVAFSVVGNLLVAGASIAKNEYQKQQRLDSLQETKLRLEVERLKKIDSTFKNKK